MNFGSRTIPMFNRVAPKISRGIGQAVDLVRIGHIAKLSRNVGSVFNQISCGRLFQSPIGKKIKMQEIK